MRSVLLAMLWEFWKCGRVIFLTMLLIVVAVSTLPIIGDWVTGNLNLSSDLSILSTLYVVSIVLQLIAFPSAILVAQGHPARYYPRPIATGKIVGFQLVVGAATAAALSLLVTGLMKIVFGLPWAYAGPALLVASTTLFVQGITWFGRGAPSVQAILGAMAFTIPIFWFNSQLSPLAGAPMFFWRRVTPAQIWIMAAYGILGAILALIAIVRDRRGDVLRSFRVQEFLDRLTVPFSATARFRSAAYAQLWFEWRQKGWWLPTAMLSALAFVIFFWIASGRTGAIQDGLHIVAVTLIAAGVAVGVVLGRYNRQVGRYEMGTFLATRPISDAGITASTFLTGGLSLILSIALWLGANALLPILNSDPASGNHWTAESILSPAVPLLLLGWLLMSLITCVMMTGRPKAFMIVLNVFVLILLIWTSVASRVRYDHDTRLPTFVCVAISVVTLIVTVVMFFKARRKQLIGWRAATLGLALPVLTLLYALNQSANHTSPSLTGTMLGLMAAALLVMPLAAGPLAVSWNRHR